MKTSKTKAVIYVRVASHNEQKKKMNQQEEQVRAFALARGYTVDEKHVYRELGFSGSLPIEKRPTLQKLMDDAKKGSFRVVLIRDISRLFRHTGHMLGFLYELDQLGIRVVTTMGGSFDSGVPSDRMAITIITSMAELERNHIRELTIRGINKKKNGTNNKKDSKSRSIHSSLNR